MKTWLKLTKYAADTTIFLVVLPFLVMLFNAPLAFVLVLFCWVFISPVLGALALIFATVAAGIYVNEPGQTQRRRTDAIVLCGLLLLAAILVIVLFRPTDEPFLPVIGLVAASLTGLSACVVIGIAWYRSATERKTPAAVNEASPEVDGAALPSVV